MPSRLMYTAPPAPISLPDKLERIHDAVISEARRHNLGNFRSRAVVRRERPQAPGETSPGRWVDICTWIFDQGRVVLEDGTFPAEILPLTEEEQDARHRSQIIGTKVTRVRERWARQRMIEQSQP